MIHQCLSLISILQISIEVIFSFLSLLANLEHASFIIHSFDFFRCDFLAHLIASEDSWALIQVRTIHEGRF